MYKAYKGGIPYKLDKKFLKLSTLHSHNTRLTSNKFYLSRISTSYGKQTVAYEGVKLWFEIDPELKKWGGSPLKNF